MSFQFVFRNTYLCNGTPLNIRIPNIFYPGFRLAINAKLLTGLGDSTRYLGTIHQLLFIDGLGDVRGDSFPLVPFFQLLIPETEFNYRLVYQPVQKAFSVELSIWKDTEAMQSGGDGVGIDNTAAFTAISDQLAALATSEAATQEQLEVLHTGLISLTNGQGATANQLAALATSEAASTAQTQASLSAILAVLNIATPTPTAAPSYLKLLFDGTNGSTTFADSSSYGRSIVGYGQAKISTAQSVSGGSSLLLADSGSYLEFVWDLPLVGNFTISADLHPTSVDAAAGEVFAITSTNNVVNLLLEIDPSDANRLRFALRNDSGQGYFDFNSSAGIAFNAWTKIEAIVLGSTATLKIDGVVSGSATFSGERQQGLTRARIGRLFEGDLRRSFNGWIDNFRIF